MQELDTGIPGFEDFYKLRAGELTILTGGAAQGKTSLARQIAENVAIGGFFNEPPGRLTSITVDTTRRVVWFSTDPVATPEPSVLTAHDVSDLELAEVDSLARELHQRLPFDLIVIDHLQGLAPRDRSVCVRAAKVLAMDLEVAVILVAQASHDGFTNRSVEEVADVVLSIHHGDAHHVWVEKVKDRRGLVPDRRRLGFTGGSFVSPT